MTVLPPIIEGHGAVPRHGARRSYAEADAPSSAKNKIVAETILKYAFDRTIVDLESYFDFLQSYYRGVFAINSALAVAGITLLKSGSGEMWSASLISSSIFFSVIGAAACAWGARAKAKEQHENYLYWEGRVRAILANANSSPSILIDAPDAGFSNQTEIDIMNAKEKRLSSISALTIVYSILSLVASHFIVVG